MPLLQIILTILIFVIALGGAFLYLSRQEIQRKKRLMGVIKGDGSRADRPKDTEKDRQNKRREVMTKKLKGTKLQEESTEKKKKKVPITLLIQQAGLEISEKKFWTFSVLLMIGMIIAAAASGQSPFVILMAGIVGLLGLPRFILKRKAAKRQKKFLEEFPDALEATVRLLKAGMPVSEAILMISREYSGPVGEEMSRIYDKQKIGISLPEAAFDATKRMPLSEMHMFATGLSIQAQTGSSLSEVLTNLASVIRARFRLKRKIKALSSEAIVSASIIGALPNFVALSLYFVNRDYISVLLTDSFGKILLGGAIAWMCLGIIVMKAMINFKI